ncbi:MAG: MATE family efflux transporter, partial [Clostridiales bacterium]|nr:MATE family efflux transporter [Clostridiales bacterium]
MTEGSLWNKILGFAFPLAFTGILQQLFNAADIAVVGNFTGELGKACMAAVGANTPIISLIVNSFLGISLGTNVVIANAVGKKDDETVQKALHTSMIVAVIGGIIIALIGELLAVPILRSQNISEESLGMAITYFRIYIGGLPVILLYNFEAAVFRGMGNTRIPFIALIISG